MKRPTTLEEDRLAYHRKLERAERRAGILWALAMLAGLASWILADQLVRPWLHSLY
jgi:hypothetical protein